MTEKILTYTQKEIDSKINILENDLDDFLLIRKENNQNVRRTREQIKQWREMNLSQIKLV